MVGFSRPSFLVYPLLHKKPNHGTIVLLVPTLRKKVNLWRMSMRRLIAPVLRIVPVIALISAIFSVSGACLLACDCRAPFWTTWIEMDGAATCKDWVCWNCDKDGNWIITNSSTCTTCDAVTRGAVPCAMCKCHGKCQKCKDPNHCCVRYYAMVCDQCTHRLRFARPLECHDQFYPLCWLGSVCPCED